MEILKKRNIVTTGGPRYRIVEDSVTGHCCFEYSIIDTQEIQRHHDTGEFLWYKEVCECFDEASAQLVVSALNKAEAP